MSSSTYLDQEKLTGGMQKTLLSFVDISEKCVSLRQLITKVFQQL
jgi:hypothetical protein